MISCPIVKAGGGSQVPFTLPSHSRSILLALCVHQHTHTLTHPPIPHPPPPPPPSWEELSASRGSGCFLRSGFSEIAESLCLVSKDRSGGRYSTCRVSQKQQV